MTSPLVATAGANGTVPVRPPKYSVVIPVYNSERTIAEAVAQIRDFFQSTDRDYEIVLVNDGSTDSSWACISTLADAHEEVVAVDLLKNYGQHSANLCGFRLVTGDYVITMDDDLQNPACEIEKLIGASEGGRDLVIGRFEEKAHSPFRRLGSSGMRRINGLAFGVEPGLVLSNFRLIRRDVVDRVCRDRSATPYIPGLVLLYSRNRCNVVVRHDERPHGASTYTLRKLLRLVATVLFNHSTIPLRASATAGFLVAALSFGLGLFYLAKTLLIGSSQPGWPTVVVLLSFFNGTLIVLISVIGEYLIRVLRDQQAVSSYEVHEIVR